MLLLYIQYSCSCLSPAMESEPDTQTKIVKSDAELLSDQLSELISIESSAQVINYIFSISIWFIDIENSFVIWQLFFLRIIFLAYYISCVLNFLCIIFLVYYISCVFDDYICIAKQHVVNFYCRKRS